MKFYKNNSRVFIEDQTYYFKLFWLSSVYLVLLTNNKQIYHVKHKVSKCIRLLPNKQTSTHLDDVLQ